MAYSDETIQAQLRTLPFSHVAAAEIPLDRAAAWLRGAAATGWPLPLALAHDLGLLLTQPPRRLTLAKPDYLPFDEETGPYLAFLQRVAAHPLVRELPRWQPPLSDAVLAVALARLVEGLELPALYRPPVGPAGVHFIRNLTVALTRADPAHLWRETARDQRPDWARLLPPPALARIESNLARLDRSELRFLVRYGPPLTGSPDPRDLFDLFALTGLPPQVRLAVSQTLKLLPRVSAARTVGGVQTYPEGGYEGLSRKGSLDSLLLIEAAYPEDIFLHRLLNHEALYYGRERPRDRRRELAYIVVQSGPGLGGDGELMARALLLALSQAMRRRGYEIRYSFAGAELTDPQPLDKPGQISQALYYRQPERIEEERILRGVLKQLKSWREGYRGRQVLWVVSEFFDADLADEHAPLYRALREEGGHQAWFIHTTPAVTVEEAARSGPGNGRRQKPPAARYFESRHFIDTGLLWQGEPPPERKPLPPAPPRPAWHKLRDEIESRPFRAGGRDVRHFTEEVQWEAWLELARMEEAPAVDDYLRRLAPPDMIYIPPGPFLMGSPDDDPDADDREKPQHELWLPGYYIDRTPVTNAQYRRFIEAGGYDRQEFWTEAGWARKERDGWRQPRRWDDDRFVGDDKPVVGVSWYEALAYARWAGKMLPSEAQWEKAAAWDPVAKKKRKYPWGDRWEESRCNNSQRIGRTTPVGQYSPAGDSPYGLVDMAGNVWEWCSSRWGTGWDRPDYLYPYEAGDGREDLSGGDNMYRIFRGGSWYSSDDRMRCGYRFGDFPGDWIDDGGFRCLTPHAFFPPVLASEFWDSGS